ncbi:MAG: hypothetical protein EOO28_15405 [Comamonadaceae bacterium]|nr:MAG: hypothetical protein EOO28_15405 [Comamonadaceae bacterium]
MRLHPANRTSACFFSLLISAGILPVSAQSTPPDASRLVAPVTFAFCWHSDVDSRKHFVTAVFPLNEYPGRPDRDVSDQFEAMLVSRYHLSSPTSICQKYLTMAKAQNERQSTWNLFHETNVTKVSVEWAPKPAP